MGVGGSAARLLLCAVCRASTGSMREAAVEAGTLTDKLNTLSLSGLIGCAGHAGGHPALTWNGVYRRFLACQAANRPAPPPLLLLGACDPPCRHWHWPADTSRPASRTSHASQHQGASRSKTRPLAVARQRQLVVRRAAAAGPAVSTLPHAIGSWCWSANLASPGSCWCVWCHIGRACSRTRALAAGRQCIPCPPHPCADSTDGILHALQLSAPRAPSCLAEQEAT